MQKAKNENELKHAIDLLFETDKKHALIEECIIGMELTVGVIATIRHKHYLQPSGYKAQDILSIEEKFLPGAGEKSNSCNHSLKMQLAFVQNTVASAYKALGCKGYSRKDCFYQTAHKALTGKERVVILENKSLPGFTAPNMHFPSRSEIGLSLWTLSI